MLVAADDVGDPHLDVVDDVGEHEDRRAVAAQQHEVLDRVVVELDIAADDVVDDGGPVGDAEAQHPSRRRTEPAIARVPVVPLTSGRLGPLLDLLAGQVAVVGVTVGEQPLGGGDVLGGVGALEVRALEHRVVGRRCRATPARR